MIYLSDKLKNIALECDVVIDSKNINGINSKIDELNSLLATERLNNYICYINYLLGNLNVCKSDIFNEKNEGWKNNNYPENQVKAIDCFRKASDYAKNENDYIKYEIITNLANSLCFFGRYIEAIKLWPLDYTLPGDSPFVSNYRCANVIYYLSRYISFKDNAFEYKFRAGKIFNELSKSIENTKSNKFKNILNEEYINKLISSYKRHIADGKSDLENIVYEEKYDHLDEKAYREWRYENCLSLNYLNDIVKVGWAERDNVQFPDYITSINEGPFLSEAFSAIKREYCYARFTFFEGIHSKNCPRYECKFLFLTDSGGGIDYTLEIEKIKSAFRIVFSLFDKLSMLMFKYFKQKEEIPHCNFSAGFIRNYFSKIENPFISSLYWISCDFQELKNLKRIEEWRAPKPVADNLKKYRHITEHNWLRIAENASLFDSESDHDYANTLKKEELIALTMEAFQMARSAIMYFVYSVKYQENKRDVKNAQKIETPIWLHL